MKKCPLFGVCGGCKYDFTASDYQEKKISLLKGFEFTDTPFWTEIGTRRRADFAFSDGVFGFYQHKSKNIVPVTNCPLLSPEINAVLPSISRLKWSGSGSCLITSCDNGIDIAVSSAVPYFTSEFKESAKRVKAIRITWNGKIVTQTAVPVIDFAGVKVEYPAGAFLQPTVQSENFIRNAVAEAAKGASKIADLFCGLGNFTFVLNAEGFDVCGCGVRRDLFKSPLTVGMLNKYDCVVMDPPRAGAQTQCMELIKSSVPKIIYISCNPHSFRRDARILFSGGYKITRLQAIDQFVGSEHWELFSVFQK